MFGANNLFTATSTIHLFWAQTQHTRITMSLWQQEIVAVPVTFPEQASKETHHGSLEATNPPWFNGCLIHQVLLEFGLFDPDLTDYSN